MTIMHRVGAMLMLFLFPGISWAQEQKVQSVTLDLKTAIGIALNENPTIKVADVEIEKKDYSKKETIAGLFPRIDGSASYSRTIEKQTMYMDSEAFDMSVYSYIQYDKSASPRVSGSADRRSFLFFR